MASNSQFTEMYLEGPLSKIFSEILIFPWTWLWWMGATWPYEHKQIPKKSSLKLLVRFWNNLIEMFLEWPFSELFLKFWSVDKHGTCISEWRLLALYRHKEVLVNSSLKTTKKKWLDQSQKIRWAIQDYLGPLVSLKMSITMFYWRNDTPSFVTCRLATAPDTPMCIVIYGGQFTGGVQPLQINSSLRLLVLCLVRRHLFIIHYWLFIFQRTYFFHRLPW